MADIAPDVVAELVDTARGARERSHAPYSKFRAGAAVLTDDGSVVAGAIVENISLGLAMCAERVAMFSAATASTPTPTVVALVLAAPDTGDVATWPCGACRQVALELGGPETSIASIGVDDDPPHPASIAWRPLGDLLPDAPHRRR